MMSTISERRSYFEKGRAMPEGGNPRIQRIAAILDYFVDHPGDVGISELSRAVGSSKSVIHRVLAEFQAHGYVAVDEDTRRYRLGFKALQLGLVALSRIDVRQLAVPHLERLRSVTKETANLSLRVGFRRVYIESFESPQEIRQRVELGREIALYLGASSKAILAFMDSDERERVLREAETVGEPNHGRMPVDVDRLRADLAAIRIRGYAVSVSERLIGAFSVAVPIFDHREQVVGSVSVSGPTTRWHEELAESYGELLVAEIGQLSRDLGSRRRPVVPALEPTE